MEECAPDFLFKSLGGVLHRPLRRVCQNPYRLMIRRKTAQRVIGHQETQGGDGKRPTVGVTGILAKDAWLPNM